MTEVKGRWNCIENKCHINSFELQAAFFCLKAFCKTSLHVLLKLDNTTTVAYFNKKRGTFSASCNKQVRDIWNCPKGQNIWIIASHVHRVKITTANLRSRLFHDKKERSLNLNKSLLRDAKSLFDQFWKTEIHLFASCLNTKCNKYASYKLDSDASHVNGFSLSWSDLNSCIFPPFSFWKSACQTCTALGDSLGDSPLLANTAMVPIICTIVETRTDTTINTRPSTPAPVSRNKLRTPNLGSAQSVSSNFLGSSQQQERQLTLPRSSWRASTQLAYSTPVQRWLEFCRRRQLNPYQPTVSQVFDFLHTLFELGLNYSATGAHWSAISATVEIPGVP